MSCFGFGFHKGVSLDLVSGSLEENLDGERQVLRESIHFPGCAQLRDSVVQQGLGFTFLVSESKGSGVGVLAFWASSGGGANTRGSPKGRAAAKFISG